MFLPYDFCLARAAEAAETAARCTLVNARTVALRSRDSWLAIAERMRRVEAARQRRAEAVR